MSGFDPVADMGSIVRLNSLVESSLMGRIAIVLYLAAMIAVIVGIDAAVFKDRAWDD